MNKLITVLVITLFLFGCNTKRYGHYGYVKKSKALKEYANHQKEVVSYPSLTHGNKQETKNIHSLEPHDSQINNSEIIKDSTPIIPDSNHNIIIKDKVINNDSDEFKVNTNSKIAFWSSVGAIATIGGAVFLTELFLIITPVLALLAFVFAIVALRQIKHSGEYGKPKAEFALFVAIPMLLAGILFGIAYYNILNNGIAFTLTF